MEKWRGFHYHHFNHTLTERTFDRMHIQVPTMKRLILCAILFASLSISMPPMASAAASPVAGQSSDAASAGLPLAMPAPSFAREAGRLLGLKMAAPAAAAPTTTATAAALEAEAQDLQSALQAAKRDAAQMRDALAGYRALRQAMAAAAPGRPFDLKPHQKTLEALPAEFTMHLEGAAVDLSGDTTHALERWGAVLTLPEGERRHRSVWASFMIGRRCAESDPERARIFLAECRRLAASGFADPLGLSAESLAWQARAELASGEPRQALLHALEQGRLPGRAVDLALLRRACEALAAGSAEDLADLAQDPFCRPALSAYALAGGAKGDFAGAWLKAVGAAELKPQPAEAEDLAWLAYNLGDVTGASRWLALAAPPGAAGRWLETKLLLRGGQADRAVEKLEALRRELGADEMWESAAPSGAAMQFSPRRAVCAELVALRLARGQHVEALALTLESGEWPETARLAERTLPVAGVEDFLRQHEKDLGAARARLAALLARRLMREGQYARARSYFVLAGASVLPELDRFLRAQRIIAAPGVADALRAGALFQSAQILHDHGRELLAAEAPGSAANAGSELAAGMMWACAGLLPDNEPLLAAALWRGGRYVAARDPRRADKFYKALARRCAKLPSGQCAVKAHWLPAEAPPVPPLVLPTNVHVAPNGDDRNDGASWATAKLTLGAAIATARLTGGQVWVAAGRYGEALRMEEGMAFYGGFRGVETSLAQRRLDPTAPSILDASAAEGGRPARHAVLIDSLTSATLDGFVIRGGEARGVETEACGGGVLCLRAGEGVSIANCVITANRAALSGGGIHLAASSPAITSCSLAGNRADDGGGAIAVTPGSRPRIADCVFADNGARFGEGGALLIDGVALRLERCRLAGNWADTGEGGAAALRGGALLAANCAFFGNTAGARGGALCAAGDSTLTLRHCTLAENGATRAGGAVFLGEAARGDFQNCIFAGQRNCAVFALRPKTGGAPALRIDHCLLNANAPAHLRLVGAKEIACATAREVNEAVGAWADNRGGYPAFAREGSAKSVWSAMPSYDPETNTTVLTDRDADFSALAGRRVLLRPDRARRTVGLAVAVRNRHALELLGDFTGLTAKGAGYLIYDERLQNGSPALGGGAPLADAAADIEGRPRGGRVDCGAAQAPASFKAGPDRTAPFSAIGALPQASAQRTLAIPFIARDEQSAIRSVRLFFQKDNEPWRLGNVAVAASGLLRFDAMGLGDGAYRFRTVAIDAAGNAEAAPERSEAQTLIVSRFAGKRIYVDAQARPGGLGQDWGRALPRLGPALAIAAASGAKEVWVAEGSYREAAPLPEGVTLYGGFKGGETDVKNRDPKRRAVTLDLRAAPAAARKSYQDGAARLDGVKALTNAGAPRP